MAFTKEQIKEFEGEEKDASEFYEYRKIGSDLAEAENFTVKFYSVFSL
jgi:hypothetical protein